MSFASSSAALAAVPVAQATARVVAIANRPRLRASGKFLPELCNRIDSTFFTEVG
jgi:hypothetical protein